MALGTLLSWSYWPTTNSLACSSRTSTVNYRAIVISSTGHKIQKKTMSIGPVFAVNLRVLVYIGISSDYSFYAQVG